MSPTSEETAKPTSATSGRELAGSGVNQAIARAINNPSPVPSAPPTRQSATVSARNCASKSRLRAPTLRRIPISRVRSRTFEHDVRHPEAAHRQRDAGDDDRHEVEAADHGLIDRRRRISRGDKKSVFLI